MGTYVSTFTRTPCAWLMANQQLAPELGFPRMDTVCIMDVGKENTVNSSVDIVRQLALIRAQLNERFTVTRIGVFGSCVRDEDAPTSDVDILVDLAEPTFDHYMDLKFLLEDLLQRPVDLVLADALKPRIKPVIEREVIYV